MGKRYAGHDPVGYGGSHRAGFDGSSAPGEPGAFKSSHGGSAHDTRGGEPQAFPGTARRSEPETGDAGSGTGDAGAEPARICGIDPAPACIASTPDRGHLRRCAPDRTSAPSFHGGTSGSS